MYKEKVQLSPLAYYQVYIQGVPWKVLEIKETFRTSILLENLEVHSNFTHLQTI